MQIFWSSKSESGGRPTNEDDVFADPAIGLYMVADGKGAPAGGRTAAELAIATVKTELEQQAAELGETIEDETESFVDAAVVAAHQAILEAQQLNPALKGMTTTLALALHRGDELHLAHIGNSRIYLWRNGELRQLTQDHSLSNLIQANVPHRLKLDQPAKPMVMALGLEPKPPRIDHQTLTLEADSCILLCSDGLSDVVPDWVLREILQGSTVLPEDEIAACLLRAAMSHGTKDNASVVLLRASDPAAKKARPQQSHPAKSARKSGSNFLGWLTFIEGSRKGVVIQMESRTTVGSDEGSMIIVDDRFVSAQHAEIYSTEQGFVIRDLGSTNGTFLNNVRIKQQVLMDNDLLRFGRTSLVFKGYRIAG